MVVGYLLVVALLSLVFFILIFRHYRQSIREGRPEPFRFMQVVISWVLMFVFIGSLGGAVYTVVRGHSTNAQVHDDQSGSSSAVSSSATSTSVKKLAVVGVTFSPKSPTLTGDDIKVNFKVSPQTKLQIVGHFSGKHFKSFKANDDRQMEHFKYHFASAGTYDLVAKRGNKTVTKQLVIKDGVQSSSSSSSSIVSSSSVSEVSSSSSSVVSSPISSNSSSIRSTTTGTTSSTARRYSSTRRSYSPTTGTAASSVTNQQPSTSETSSSATGEYRDGETAQ